jgi:hypothetical protein
MPRKLRRDLPEFFIRTAQEEGWSAFKNGQLLKRAVGAFDVFVTIDQNMRYQQNMSDLTIGIVAIEIPDTRLVYLRVLTADIRDAVQRVKPGEVIIVGHA